MPSTFLEHVIALGSLICAVAASAGFALLMTAGLVHGSANPIYTALEDLSYIKGAIFVTILVYTVVSIMEDN